MTTSVIPAEEGIYSWIPDQVRDDGVERVRDDVVVDFTYSALPVE